VEKLQLNLFDLPDPVPDLTTFDERQFSKAPPRKARPKRSVTSVKTDSV
jgi:hypothetical protein